MFVLALIAGTDGVDTSTVPVPVHSPHETAQQPLRNCADVHGTTCHCRCAADRGALQAGMNRAVSAGHPLTSQRLLHNCRRRARRTLHNEDGSV